MSVDIAQLTARLDSDRRDAVKQQYEERATNPTAAFLLCFFLGFAGAHRFYLHEWRSAFGHLALFALGAASLIAGLTQTLPLTTSLTAHPLGAALDAIGLALLLAALIWEIIDLGRIDHQVYRRNLLLAEGIIAATLLADPSVVEHARQTLSEVARQTHAQPFAAAPAALAGAGAAAGAGVITASEVADARALAEETGGYSSISYTEMSRFDVSADPDQARQASADTASEGNWAESITTAELQPSASADAEPETLIETMTRVHTEDGGRVTDSYEVDRRTEPSAAELAGLGAAGLGAAGLAAAGLGAASGAGFDEPTQPDITTSAAAETPAYEPAQPYEPYEPYEPYQPPQPLDASEASAYDAPGYAPAPAADAGSAFVAQPASYASDSYDFEDDELGDVTDHSMPAVVIPPADVAIPNASPAYVQFDDAASAPAAPATPEAPEAPLYLIPDEPATAAPDYGGYGGYASYDASPTEAPTEEPPAEAYVPPVAPVFSPPAAEPAAPRASWESPTEPAAAPEPAYDYGYGATGGAGGAEAAPAEPQGGEQTLAELAGFAGLAGAGALAGDALAHSQGSPAPEPVAAEPAPAPTPETTPEPAAPAPPKMKKIRVRRQVVLDGKVVDEIVVEREVPADMDSAEAAAKIQEELSHFTPEEIAQRAHLAPNEEIELRQRNQGEG